MRSTVDEGELHALVDGRLSAHRRGAVLAHLLVDGADRERVEAYRRQLAGLARIREGLEGFAAGFAPELQRALADRVLRARRQRLLARGGAGLIAASLLLVAVLGLVGRSEGDGERLAAAVVYEPEFGGPEFPFGGRLDGGTTRPQGDRERSLAWLAGHLRDQPLELPDLRGLGLVPVGGEVLENGSAPAVRLAWTDAGGRTVDLYVGVVSSNAEQAFTMVGEGFVSLHWRRGQLVFALVGPAESPQLLHVVQAVMNGLGAPDEPLPAGKGLAPAAEPRPIRAVVEPAETAAPTLAPVQEPLTPSPEAAPPAKLTGEGSKPL